MRAGAWPVHDRRHRAGVESIPALTRRLFAGLELDGATRDGCAGAAERLQRTGFAARYESADNYHLTLAFLGNVAAGRFAQMTAALRRAANACAAFEICLDKLGAFPHERKPRIVFAGARRQGPKFAAMAATVRDVYRSEGFRLEGDAIAHVTIARVKDPRRPLPPVEIQPIRFAVRSIALFESVLDPERGSSRYTVVERAPAAGAAAG
ncbi:MAG TPA: RNA 2',3'-cyclic phosphodiesterase [Candidatus Acidoferrales bacterium]|nr:RNA 2',3'-cyclic phosphodiesterase [Candidatus Acidoferrales bacterium]